MLIDYQPLLKRKASDAKPIFSLSRYDRLRRPLHLGAVGKRKFPPAVDSALVNMRSVKSFHAEDTLVKGARATSHRHQC